MVKKDRRIKNLEEELGVNVTEILRGILPRRAIKEIGRRKLKVIFDYAREWAIGGDIRYGIVLRNTRVGFCTFYFEKDKFIFLRYRCTPGDHSYNTESSLRQLRR